MQLEYKLYKYKSLFLIICHCIPIPRRLKYMYRYIIYTYLQELKLVDPQPPVISTIAANNLISKDSALRAESVRLYCHCFIWNLCVQ